MENRCSRKVFHTGVPTLAIDFSLGGLASLPVVLPGLPLYTLLRGSPRAEARDHRVGGGKEGLWSQSSWQRRFFTPA
jgi:hypothetical protein